MAIEEEFGFEISDEMAERHDYSTIERIVEAIDALESLKHSPSYNLGVVDGRRLRAVDRLTNMYTPKYLPDDVNGADSVAHADYIRGYVFGYSQ